MRPEGLGADKLVKDITFLYSECIPNRFKRSVRALLSRLGKLTRLCSPLGLPKSV